MGKYPWFRQYAEWSTDPKIQSMSETLQRRHIMLHCLQCNGELLNLTEEEISIALRISLEELELTKKVFIQKGFVDKNWKIINWDKRQFLSDFSTERSRISREKKRLRDCSSSMEEIPNATEMQRCNSVAATELQRQIIVDATPPDTEAYSDKDIIPPVTLTSDIPQGEVLVSQEPLPEDLFIDEIPEEVFQLDPPPEKKKIGAPGFDKFWEAYPKKVSKGHAEKTWGRIRPSELLVEEMLNAIAVAKKSRKWKDDRGKFIPNPATWLNAKGWLDEISLENSLSKPGDPRGKWWGKRLLENDEKLPEEVSGGK